MVNESPPPRPWALFASGLWAAIVGIALSCVLASAAQTVGTAVDRVARSRGNSWVTPGSMLAVLGMGGALVYAAATAVTLVARTRARHRARRPLGAGLALDTVLVAVFGGAVLAAASAYDAYRGRDVARVRFARYGRCPGALSVVTLGRDRYCVSGCGRSAELSFADFDPPEGRVRDGCPPR